MAGFSVSMYMSQVAIHFEKGKSSRRTQTKWKHSLGNTIFSHRCSFSSMSSELECHFHIQWIVYVCVRACTMSYEKGNCQSSELSVDCGNLMILQFNRQMIIENMTKRTAMSIIAVVLSSSSLSFSRYIYFMLLLWTCTD